MSDFITSCHLFGRSFFMHIAIFYKCNFTVSVKYLKINPSWKRKSGEFSMSKVYLMPRKDIGHSVKIWCGMSNIEGRQILMSTFDTQHKSFIMNQNFAIKNENCFSKRQYVTSPVKKIDVQHQIFDWQHQNLTFVKNLRPKSIFDAIDASHHCVMPTILHCILNILTLVF